MYLTLAGSEKTASGSAFFPLTHRRLKSRPPEAPQSACGDASCAPAPSSEGGRGSCRGEGFQAEGESHRGLRGRAGRRATTRRVRLLGFKRTLTAHFIDELHPNKSYLCGGRGQRGVSPASGLRKASLLPLVMGGDGCLPRLRRDCSGAPACFRGRLERVGQESGSRESVLGLRLSLLIPRQARPQLTQATISSGS